MIHSHKNIWIAIFSLFAMLMSSYVSSMPMMAMNNAPSYSMASDERDSHQHHHVAEYRELSSDAHSDHKATNCHSESHPTVDLAAHNVMESSHCSDSSSSVDTCCISVCSSTSYPTSDVDAPHSLSFSLALHQSDTIGAPVTRIQTLLRPPSA
ncbi:hypothetical protein EJ063_02595 [Vibrio aquaticus]|uniref:DUF2946 domain-containing protein n=1 Tax=Vibrio aquaticus TaxID=2496559 RepID=A0A432D176_9VIBR|nr:hypothetical protein [Vibrio aquaticus]RTZ17693.1 hypothetical protein EJ063_02595 [Vibrio aquaticus]